MNLCTGCKRDFTGVSNFDAHRKLMRKPPWGRCVDPAKLGMVQNARGQWGNPGNVLEGYVPAAERPAHEFERECVECGSIFMRPRTRGRPPTKCEDCR